MAGAAVTMAGLSRRRYLPLRLRAFMAERWLALNIVVTAVSLAVNLWHLDVLSDDARDVTAVDASTSRVAVVSLAEMIVYVIGVVIFLAWFHRAYVNVEALGVQPRHRGGWAIWGWFIPIVALFRPKELANDIWRSADPEPDPPGNSWLDRPLAPVLGVWWLLWLVAGITGWFAFRMPIDTIDQDRDATTVTVMSQVLFVLAALAAIVVVRKLTARQQQRAEQLGLAD